MVPTIAPSKSPERASSEAAGGVGKPVVFGIIAVAVIALLFFGMRRMRTNAAQS